MNTELIQDLRYKLQKRVRRLNSVEYEHYHATLRRYWHFLNSKDIFGGVLDELKRAYPQHEELIAAVPEDGSLLAVETEEELAAVAYFIIQHCVESDDSDVIWRTAISLKQGHVGKVYEEISAFHSLFVEPLYEYIDEHLDDQRAILAFLRRYKHKCEWFQSRELFDTWKEETRIGEKRLALNLYEYLHDQGLDFSIEPASVSGEIDLIAAQNTEDPLLADAKIFNPEHGKGKLYLANALNQIYIYTQNYNEPFGYLIIFKTCPEDLRLALTNVDQSTPYIIHNNKTIFLVVIDIYPHETSASKRGKVKAIEIDEDYLIEIIEEKTEEV